MMTTFISERRYHGGEESICWSACDKVNITSKTSFHEQWKYIPLATIASLTGSKFLVKIQILV